VKAIQAGLALGVALCAAPLVMRAQADDAPPAWAYAVNPPDFRVQPDDGTPRHVPDSTAVFTVTQARDMFIALDWHPSDHPLLPGIVARGRKPDVMACGVCHRADRKMPELPAFPHSTSCSRWPTSKAARGQLRFPNEPRRS
jgi:hypothetical protein